MKAGRFPFTPEIRSRILHWAAEFPCAAFLDSCGTTTDHYGQYDFLAGVSERSECKEEFPASGKGWHFGRISYEWKNVAEPLLESHLPAYLPSSPLQFFAAQIVIFRQRGENEIQIYARDPEAVFAQIRSTKPAQAQAVGFRGFESDITKEEYLQRVARLKAHIREGDCYEINFCRQFTASGRLVHPAAVLEKLLAISPVPFGGFLRMGQQWLLCASPERFLQHRNGMLITQPIKGTAPRGNTEAEDLLHVEQLRNSEKEQAENVMIVDLSRNDLNRSCEAGSVTVPHLFEVQSFAQVHQMVSTVCGKLRADVSPVDAIRNAFPPGSMTGAPKVKVCGLIGQYETSARGIYSGSFGYFDPQGNYDLNVVIRSVVYDEREEKICFHTGGAITWDSDPEAEWEETIVKARAIRELFAGLHSAS